MRIPASLSVLSSLFIACQPRTDSATGPEPLAATVPAGATAPVVIHVDDGAAPGGDGTASSPFDDLPDAVAYARTLDGAVTIRVQPGEYALAQTLVIDRSLELRGSTEQLPSRDPWPSGDVVTGTATRIFASNPSLTELVLVGRGDGTVLNRVEIRGFVFEGSAAGVSLLLRRVQDYRVAGNVFRAPANFGMQSIASSGLVSGNHFSGVGTGAIFNGGYAESPSNVAFQNNRAVRNTIGGVLLNGASINIPELGDVLTASVRDNDLSENQGTQGFGLRAFILRRDLGAPGDSQAYARVVAVVQTNRIVGNRVGVYIDAGFPFRSVGTTCDNRVYTGSMALRFAGNTISGSLLTPALVTFTRNLAALNPAILPQWQYLHGATFDIQDPDALLAGARIDHPAMDPFLGPCPDDATQEVLGNVLIYNGQVVPNVRNF